MLVMVVMMVRRRRRSLAHKAEVAKQRRLAQPIRRIHRRPPDVEQRLGGGVVVIEAHALQQGDVKGATVAQAGIDVDAGGDEGGQEGPARRLPRDVVLGRDAARLAANVGARQAGQVQGAGELLDLADVALGLGVGAGLDEVGRGGPVAEPAGVDERVLQAVVDGLDLGAKAQQKRDRR